MEDTYQRLQAGMFSHGSARYVGGTLVVDAASTKRLKATEGGGWTIVTDGGIPLWTARLWRVRYSRKGSEAVLVRQLNRFYLLIVTDGKPEYREMPSSRFETQFRNLSS